MKIAIVITWFGETLKGGAEQQAWQIAQRLKQSGCDAHVLTTCSQSFLGDWDKDYFKPGTYDECGIIVKRFEVRKKRNTTEFSRVVTRLLSLPLSFFRPGTSPISKEDEAIYLNENIQSHTLFEFLKDNVETYDRFLFMPYLFPMALKGLPLVLKKAILQPCLHDECYAYLPEVVELFECAPLILFNSRGEQNTAVRLFGDHILGKSIIIGEGVEVEEQCLQLPKNKLVEGSIFSQDFILYLGKRCEEKNTHLLLEAFEEFVEAYPTDLKLAIAGAGELPRLPRTEHVYDLGLVDERTKIELLRRCKALINPSVNESFSRVIFEAWHLKKPILVNQRCEATFFALEDSQGGGWAADNTVESFKSALKDIANSSLEDFKIRGEKGYIFAKQTSDWGAVTQRYHQAFKASHTPPSLRSTQTFFEIERQQKFNWELFETLNRRVLNILVLAENESKEIKLFLKKFSSSLKADVRIFFEEKDFKTLACACDFALVFKFEIHKIAFLSQIDLPFVYCGNSENRCESVKTPEDAAQFVKRLYNDETVYKNHVATTYRNVWNQFRTWVNP